MAKLDTAHVRNVGEFYSQHYLDAVLADDLEVVLAGWTAREAEGGAKAPYKRLAALAEPWFKALAEYAGEDDPERRNQLCADFHARLLDALGYARAPSRALLPDGRELPRTLAIEHQGRPHLWVVEARFPVSEDDADPLGAPPLDPEGELAPATIQSTTNNNTADDDPPATTWRELLDGPLLRHDHAPRWVLLLAGPDLFLIDRDKWALGQYLHFENLQKVARDILLSKGINLQKPATQAQQRAAWTRALDAHTLEFHPVFYKEEWSRVVQAQDVIDEDGYFRAARVGRGQRLTRGQRKHVWKILAEYRQQLDLAGLSEHADFIREARLALGHSPARDYVAVVADEIQDFRAADLVLLRALVPEGPNDIFVVGDPHQRIYGHKASLSRCGISVRGLRSRKLRINYRTTHEIRNWAVARLQGLEIDDLDDGTDSLKGERSLRSGDPPEISMFADIDAETRHIADLVRAWQAEGVAPEHICIVTRTKPLIADSYAPALRSHGIHTTPIDTDASDALPPGVRIASMHRVKGLEFPRMILAGIQQGTMPLEDAAYATRDDTARALHDEGERKLLYVAATRARDLLVITGHGQRSALV